MEFVAAINSLFSKQAMKARRPVWETEGSNCPKFVYLVAQSEFVSNKEPLISLFGVGSKFFYASHVDAYYGVDDNGVHCLSAYIPSQEDREAVDWIIE